MSKPKEKPPAATEGSNNNNITCPQGSDAAAASQPRNVSFWPSDMDDTPLPPVQAPKPPSMPTSDVGDLVPPGLVGEVAQYIYSSAVRPVREIALGAALGLVAGIAGRAYNVSGTGLNQYLLVVAGTGTGKEDGVKGIERLLAALRRQVPAVDDFIGPGAFASGQGLIRTLDKQPSIFCMLGEFGLTLQMLNDPRAPSSTQLLKRALLDLYSKSGWDDVLRSTAYSDSEKDTKIVFAPALSFVGDTTPETLYDALSPRDIASGLLPRMTIIEYKGKRPDRNARNGTPPDRAVVEHLTSLAQSALAMRNDNRNMPVLANPAGQAVLDGFDKECDTRMRDDGASVVNKELWNRAHLKALKVAALLAVGIDHHSPVITETVALWAIEFTKRSTRDVLGRFEAGEVGTGEARQEAELKRIASDYLRLSPKARLHGSYAVPEKLAMAREALSVSYLRKRAAQCSAFNYNRKGFDGAFKSTLEALCDSGWLFKMDKNIVHLKFGPRMGDVYVIGANFRPVD